MSRRLVQAQPGGHFQKIRRTSGVHLPYFAVGTHNGAPVIFNGAPLTQNGAPKYPELKPVVVNGTIFDRVPDSLEGAPVTVNEAPSVLEGRQWYKIPHLWFFNPRTDGGGGYPPPPSGFSQTAKKTAAHSAAKFAIAVQPTI